MSDAVADDVADIAEDEAMDADGGDEKASGKGKSKLRLLLMILVPVIALSALGGGVVWYFGLTEPAATTAKSEKPAPKMLYYDLPEMVVNLSGDNKRRVQYLKLKVSLETVDPMALKALGPAMPRVLDVFQVYLRELRVTDLEGSAGVFRLKEELLRRVNLAIHPHQINRVLFKEIIVQ